MSITSRQLIEAAHKAAAWITTRQTPKGNYIGNEPVDANGIYADTHDIGCYYKSTHFLRAAGESLTAARAINYVVDSFMQPTGDLYNNRDNRTSGSYTPTYCQLYPNMWILRATAAMEWTDLTQRIMKFLLSMRDEETGGFYAAVNPATDIIDSNATGYGILCCLLAGEVEAAVKAGELILRMFKEQPDPERLYLRWRKDSGYVTDLSDIPEKHRIYAVIDSKEGSQAYWCWAWPMNGLVKLYGHTGEDRYLKGAIEIYDFLASCHEHAFHFTTAGKCGWGSAMLYRITGDKRYQKTALSQMEFILDHQHGDGYMLGPGAESFEAQPLRTTYDFTADFGSWLVGAAMEFANRE